MAVQSQQYPAHVVHLPENHSNRARAPQYEVDHRGFLSAGINYNFQIPSSVNMNAFNQYHVCTQLCSGGRHMPTNQQDHDILAATAAFTTKFNAANAMMGARKRTRDQVEEFCSPWPSPPPPQQQQQQFVINATTQLDTHPGAVVNPATTANNVSTGLRLTFEDDSRLRSVSPPPPEPAWAEDLATYMHKEREDIAQLLKAQSGQLKTFLEERRQRRTRELITAAEEGFARKLREKDAEMEKVRRQNQELMDRLTQLNAESQHWQTKVRNTEAMVNMLRSNLAQAQQQNVATAAAAAAAAAAQQFPPHPNTKEGCGDSEQADDCASSYVDDINDAHTRACNENRELREQRTCRVCRCNDVSMLLLPCRHLCLCQDCETQLHACPLCRTPKNASVQVYMS